jgi:hypothetical protein
VREVRNQSGVYRICPSGSKIYFVGTPRLDCTSTARRSVLATRSADEKYSENADQASALPKAFNRASGALILKF